MIDRAQHQYLKDVLGISQVIVPEGLEPVRAKDESEDFGSMNSQTSTSEKSKPSEVVPVFNVYQSSEAPVAVVSNHVMSEPQKDLAGKILKAVGIAQPAFVEVNLMSEKMIEELENALPARWFVYFEEHFEKFYGTIEKLKGSQVLYTYDLDTMLSGNATDIQGYKRQVWQHMKLFSSRWEGTE